ncbi:MAG: rRNA maturation RNase YbeY [Bacteroidales bacterium]|nr:rRNA maturation RNase YbeY [Bacteroidales bacterium]
MINFFYEDTEFRLSQLKIIDSWIKDVVCGFDREIGELTYILTSDKYLLSINQKFLNHDFYTDVITFNYCDGSVLSGDIFISYDRVKDNSIKYKQTFCSELLRVIIHGVLHLLGFDDKTDSEKEQMRVLEENCLSNLIIKNINCEK